MAILVTWPLYSRVTLDVRDRLMSDRRQTKASLNASATEPNRVAEQLSAL